MIIVNGNKESDKSLFYAPAAMSGGHIVLPESLYILPSVRLSHFTVHVQLSSE